MQLVNELVRSEDPRGFVVVMDRELWETVGRDNPAGDAPNPTIPQRGGALVEAPTLAALAGALGVDRELLRRAVAGHDADPRCGARVRPAGRRIDRGRHAGTLTARQHMMQHLGSISNRLPTTLAGSGAAECHGGDRAPPPRSEVHDEG